MAKKERKGLKIIGAILKDVVAKAIPGGNIIKNILTDSEGSPSSTFNKSKTWPDVAMELGKVVLWVLALKYFGIDITAII